eukprot:CAMPEP_0203683786 /NCGR_PEP_ID=MMETSP0090-20130426/47703_1 /ASSEMBLY_ACC=CAM_ASM_001088 /TAXON_ID=426623 /ORGANISM="Chaetoceros affinis, Strain CCMP159" /LENGTH=1339 /DNA_ID=CAMNT_0050552941 /DNA_START=34 /DNA_END=4053 /DNA_ORIENTATION=-
MIFSWANKQLEKLSETMAPMSNSPTSRFIVALQNNDIHTAKSLLATSTHSHSHSHGHSNAGVGAGNMNMMNNNYGNNNYSNSNGYNDYDYTAYNNNQPQLQQPMEETSIDVYNTVFHPQKQQKALHVICQYSNMELFHYVLTTFYSSDGSNSNNGTLLHYACISTVPNANKSFIQYLIHTYNGSGSGSGNNGSGSGSDGDDTPLIIINQKNIYGQTPYDVTQSDSIRQYLLPIQLQAETRECLKNGGVGLPAGCDLGGLKIENSNLGPPPIIGLGASSAGRGPGSGAGHGPGPGPSGAMGGLPNVNVNANVNAYSMTRAMNSPRYAVPTELKTTSTDVTTSTHTHTYATTTMNPNTAMSAGMGMGARTGTGAGMAMMAHSTPMNQYNMPMSSSTSVASPSLSSPANVMNPSSAASASAITSTTDTAATATTAATVASATTETTENTTMDNNMSNTNTNTDSKTATSSTTATATNVNANANVNVNAVNVPPALPDGWMELYDDSSGRYYYYNQAMNVTQWERPILSPSTEAVDTATEVEAKAEAEAEAEAEAKEKSLLEEKVQEKDEIKKENVQEEEQGQKQEQVKVATDDLRKENEISDMNASQSDPVAGSDGTGGTGDASLGLNDVPMQPTNDRYQGEEKKDGMEGDVKRVNGEEQKEGDIPSSSNGGSESSTMIAESTYDKQMEQEVEGDDSHKVQKEVSETTPAPEAKNDASSTQLETQNQLPLGWVELRDPTSGYPYYFNQEMNLTTWERPIDKSSSNNTQTTAKVEDEKAKQENHTAGTNSTEGTTDSVVVNGQSTSSVAQQGQLPTGWVELIDPSSGVPYYYNQLTNCTQWEKPTFVDTTSTKAEMKKVDSAVQKETKKQSASTTKTRASSKASSSSGYAKRGHSTIAILPSNSKYKPDGFHSSSSDARLAAKYGHNNNIAGPPSGLAFNANALAAPPKAVSSGYSNPYGNSGNNMMNNYGFSAHQASTYAPGANNNIAGYGNQNTHGYNAADTTVGVSGQYNAHNSSTAYNYQMSNGSTANQSQWTASDYSNQYQYQQYQHQQYQQPNVGNDEYPAVAQGQAQQQNQATDPTTVSNAVDTQVTTTGTVDDKVEVTGEAIKTETNLVQEKQQTSLLKTEGVQNNPEITVTTEKEIERLPSAATFNTEEIKSEGQLYTEQNTDVGQRAASEASRDNGDLLPPPPIAIDGATDVSKDQINETILSPPTVVTDSVTTSSHDQAFLAPPPILSETVTQINALSDQKNDEAFLSSPPILTEETLNEVTLTQNNDDALSSPPIVVVNDGVYEKFDGTPVDDRAHSDTLLPPVTMENNFVGVPDESLPPPPMIDISLTQD